MNSSILSLLGIARRAGKLSWHEDANLSSIRTGKARMLVLAEDAGESTAKKYRDKCLFYNVPLIVIATKNELGQALGTSPRAAVAVNDDGFAGRLEQLLNF